MKPIPDAPEWLGLSPVIWMIFAGALVLVVFVWWENRRVKRGEAALIDPAMLRNLQLRSGVMSFFFMFLIQAGLFFTLALFLSVTLGVSAVETGVRLLPLSLSLLLFAVGVPKLRPNASPRRVVRLGFIMLFAGLLLLVALLDVGVGPGIVTWPLLLAGSGLGMMASQLGAVTVSAVPDEKSGEVGGLQNTGTQLGASIGTALAGAVLISAMTASFFTGIENNPNVPDSVVSQAHTQLAGGVPFMSEADTKAALQKANVPPATADEIVKCQQTEPDRRPARRGGHPRAARARCAPVHPRDPDRPTRRPSQAQTIPGIADAAASRNHHAAAFGSTSRTVSELDPSGSMRALRQRESNAHQSIAIPLHEAASPEAPAASDSTPQVTGTSPSEQRARRAKVSY